MSYRSVVIAAAVVLSSLASAQAQEQPQKSSQAQGRGPGFVPAGWLRQPTQKELWSVMPTAASKTGQDGRAVIECEVGVDGILRKCTVFDEQPRDLGYGSAALLLSPLLKMKPATQDGRPVVSSVRIPLKWDVERGFADGGDNKSAVMQGVWTSAPTRAEVDAVRPKALPGAARVVLNCGFQEDGRLTDCQIQSADPSRYGVTGAAHKLAAKFRSRPLAEGLSLKDARILLPIQFDALDAPQRADGRLLSKPSWLKRPNPEALQFPEAARAAGVHSGRAVIECDVGDQGVMSACRTVSETPGDLGFGAAAVEAAKLFNVNPWTEEGRPVDGARVRVAIRYEDPEAVEPAAAAK